MILYSYQITSKNLIWKLFKLFGLVTYTYSEMFEDYEKGIINGKIKITDVYGIDEIFQIKPKIRKFLNLNTSESIAYADILRRSVERDLTADNRIFYIRFIKNYHAVRNSIGIYIYQNQSEKRLIRIIAKNIICIPRLTLPIANIRSLVGLMIKSIGGFLFERRQPPVYIEPSQVEGKDFVEIDKQILICPHKTLNFGGMFSKDYILPNQNHSQSYLFLEFEKNHQISDYYHENKLNVFYFDEWLFPFLKTNFVQILFKLLRSFFKLTIKNFCFNPRELSILIIFDLKVKYSEYILKKLNPKIIIVGYDILFPRHFALAAERLGVVTMGMTERVFILNVENLPVMLDTYFVPTNEVAKIVKKNPYSRVKKFVNIGIIRGDIVSKNISKYKTVKNHVVVFDFHSEKTNTMSLISWQNNLLFYEDILQLAHQFVDYNFVIRGKDLNWTKLDFFSDLYSRMKSTKNITISKDFELEESYRLLAKSPYLIARVTSIAEEAIAIGKKVIFHENFIEGTREIQKEFGIGEAAMYSFSAEDLIKKFSKLIDPSFEFRDLKFIEKLYGKIDGKARNRYLSYLTEVYPDLNISVS